jgi:hypothetical protein
LYKFDSLIYFLLLLENHFWLPPIKTIVFKTSSLLAFVDLCQLLLRKAVIVSFKAGAQQQVATYSKIRSVLLNTCWSAWDIISNYYTGQCKGYGYQDYSFHGNPLVYRDIPSTSHAVPTMSTYFILFTILGLIAIASGGLSGKENYRAGNRPPWKSYIE